MLKRLTILSWIGTAVLSAACLQKETTHTLYLDPDGSVSWVASEANVYSDETEMGKRIVEEQGYIGAALLGTHATARALAALDPQGTVRTTVVREERPFHVLTQARYAGVDRVLERVFSEAGVSTSASIVRGADSTTLRVRLDFSRPVAERDTPVSHLTDDIEHMRIVLTDGRFGSVAGFDVTEGTSATWSAEWLDQAQKACDAKTAIEFALTWSVL
jgi:hypothetical protein